MAILRDFRHYKFHLTRLSCSEEDTGEEEEFLHRKDDKDRRYQLLSVTCITCLNVVILLLSLSLFSISIYEPSGKLNKELRASSIWSK